MLINGRYVLLELIGQGGMGKVWRGRDEVLGRDVALKEVLLPLNLPQETRDQLLARTRREARAAAQLHHPSVITIHDVMDVGGIPWIVMRFVDGPSLRAEIEHAGRLPWQRLTQIGEQVADALAQAHAAGIVHRDLKPDNILLAGQHAIVTDFGIAHVADATTLTNPGTIIGTPRYMAPEQFDERPVGPAADMWALGATLYEAAEGRLPFDGSTLSAVIGAVLTKSPDIPANAGPLTDLILSLLSKDAAQRPDATTTTRVLAAFRSAPVPDPASVPVRAPTVVPAAAAPAAAQPPESPSPAAGVPGHSTETVSPRHQDAPPMPTASPTGGKPGRRRTIAISAIAAAAVIAAAIAIPLTLSSGERPSSEGNLSPSGSPSAQQTNIGPITGSLVATFTNPGRVDSVAFTPNGKTIAAGDDNGHTYLWVVTTHAKIAAVTDPNSEGVTSVAFTLDEKLLATGDRNGHTYLRGTSVTTLIDPGSQGVLSIAFTRDSKTLATGDGNGHIYLWNTTTGTRTATLTEPGSKGLDSVVFAPDGKTLATSDFSSKVYLWNTTTSTRTATVTDPDSKGIWTIAFSPDGKTLATGDENGHAYLWSTTTIAKAATLTDSGGQSINSIAFAPDGKILATGDFKGHIYLWNTTTGARTATLTAPSGSLITSVAFTADGKSLAAADYDGHVYLWRITY
jgi:serine/threonine protein kinase